MNSHLPQIGICLHSICAKGYTYHKLHYVYTILPSCRIPFTNTISQPDRTPRPLRGALKAARQQGNKEGADTPQAQRLSASGIGGERNSLDCVNIM